MRRIPPQGDCRPRTGRLRFFVDALMQVGDLAEAETAVDTGPQLRRRARGTTRQVEAAIGEAQPDDGTRGLTGPAAVRC